MFLHKGKEYYPLEIMEIYAENDSIVYDRRKRNKAYVYIAVDNSKNKGE